MGWRGEGKFKQLSQYASPLTAFQRLRYLDYHLLRRPAEAHIENSRDSKALDTAGLHEIHAIKDFGAEMERRGVRQWWRKAMEFDPPDHRL